MRSSVAFLAVALAAGAAAAPQDAKTVTVNGVEAVLSTTKPGVDAKAMASFQCPSGSSLVRQSLRAASTDSRRPTASRPSRSRPPASPSARPRSVTGSLRLPVDSSPAAVTVRRSAVGAELTWRQAPSAPPASGPPTTPRCTRARPTARRSQASSCPRPATATSCVRCRSQRADSAAGAKVDDYRAAEVRQPHAQPELARPHRAAAIGTSAPRPRSRLTVARRTARSRCSTTSTRAPRRSRMPVRSRSGAPKR